MKKICIFYVTKIEIWYTYNLQFIFFCMLYRRFHMYLKTMELVSELSPLSTVGETDYIGQDIMAVKWLEPVFL